MSWAAASAMAGEWGGAIGMATDKIVRGRSDNEHRPVAYADAQYVGDTRQWSTYAGMAAWREISGPAQEEWRAGIQYHRRLAGDLSLRASWTYYLIVPRSNAARPGYDEYGATLAWRDTLFLGVQAIPDAYRYRGEGEALARQRVIDAELSWVRHAWGPWALHGGLGHERARTDAALETNTYASIGLSYVDGQVTPALTLIGNQRRAQPRAPLPSTDAVEAQGGSRWVLSLLYSF